MATIREIAKRAGVAASTVSDVLNGRYKETWPSTVKKADRIRRIAHEMGYRPNAAAKAMTTGRFDCIAILQDFRPGMSTLPPSMLNGIHDELAEHGLHLTYARIPREKMTSESDLPKALRELMIDGLLINVNTNPPRELDLLVTSQGLPAIWINSNHGRNCVRPDDFDAGVRLTEHFIARGARRILYADHLLDPQHRHYSRADRYDGYAEAMRRASLQPEMITLTLTFIQDELSAQIEEWHAADTMPDVIIGYSPDMLWPFWQVAASLTVPFDVAIGSFSGHHFHVAGATMLVPEYAIGQEAVRLLLRRMAEPEVDVECVDVPFTLSSS